MNTATVSHAAPSLALRALATLSAHWRAWCMRQHVSAAGPCDRQALAASGCFFH